jgi:hypothetical protein
MALTKLSYEIPILHFSGNDLGSLAIQNALTAKGWYATVIPALGPAFEGGGETVHDPNAGLFTTFGEKIKEMAGAISPAGLANVLNGAADVTTARYPHAKLKVTMEKKDHSGFEQTDAVNDIYDAANNPGTQLSAFKDWVTLESQDLKDIETALTPGNILQTDEAYYAKADDQIDQGADVTIKHFKDEAKHAADDATKGISVLLAIGVVLGGVWLYLEYQSVRRTTGLLRGHVSSGKPEKKSKPKRKKAA